ncbi:hypothetical protein [Palleronia caenipelagi]|uniref:Uncharacterized protein n=1 Tax=Palleronia caenipelagi TaxID=2489174 RepID=A0A547Q6S8_9RHOB|nr:hypothetical protein [Palleronia caenipelagi]TRD22085.1 hypothetical protein FEV53_06895 [Palleronia caenipelagi]
MSKRPTFAKAMEPRHLKAVRMLGYCVALGDAAAWLGLSIVLAARLTARERAALAYAALTSMDPGQAEATAAAALDAAGMPRLAFCGGMADARHWADHATRDELKAYALAAFDAMNPRDQAAFYRRISEFEVAV